MMFFREALSVCLVYEKCYINKVSLSVVCPASGYTTVSGVPTHLIDPLKMDRQDVIGPQY